MQQDFSWISRHRKSDFSRPVSSSLWMADNVSLRLLSKAGYVCMSPSSQYQDQVDFVNTYTVAFLVLCEVGSCAQESLHSEVVRALQLIILYLLLLSPLSDYSGTSWLPTGARNRVMRLFHTRRFSLPIWDQSPKKRGAWSQRIVTRGSLTLSRPWPLPSHWRPSRSSLWLCRNIMILQYYLGHPKSRTFQRAIHERNGKK